MFATETPLMAFSLSIPIITVSVMFDVIVRIYLTDLEVIRLSGIYLSILTVSTIPFALTNTAVMAGIKLSPAKL